MDFSKVDFMGDVLDAFSLAELAAMKVKSNLAAIEWVERMLKHALVRQKPALLRMLERAKAHGGAHV